MVDQGRAEAPSRVFVSGRVPADLKDRVDQQLGRKGRLDTLLTELLECWTRAGTSEAVPLVGRVAAGPSIIAEENIEEYIVVPKRLAGDQTFALTVKGDSMAPTLTHGDIVIVHRQQSAQNNQLVVAMFGGAEAVVKRLRYPAPGSAELRSDNENYETIYSGFNVVGIVVALIRMF